MKGALVTGAGTRIGRAIALALAEDGWFVFVHHLASATEARVRMNWSNVSWSMKTWLAPSL